MYKALGQFGYAIFPADNPLLLHSGTQTIPTCVVVQALLDCDVQSVFVSAYGLKMPYTKWLAVYNIYCQAWDDNFRHEIKTHLPEHLATPETLRFMDFQNNVFHLGCSATNDDGMVYSIYLWACSRKNFVTRRYHTLGPLTRNPGTNDVYGGFTAKDPNALVSVEGITKYTCYIGQVVKYLRAGFGSGPPNRVTSNQGNQRLLARCLACYEYMRISAARDPSLLSGFRVEIEVKSTEFVSSTLKLFIIHDINIL